ncbi:hypothetical protein WT26_04210 [Burkholderia cepacia]|uniref:Uncharacterized protein n=2 Tax=Burkholderia cepacia complex TaxID=87882 RepID=A0A1B4PMZ0_BURCE|nr:hypothetical protein WT26_04210 [Burkholderia cepacia]AOK22014.1 hypothetical protein WK67_04210 [Burkholderia ubonensis]
MWLWCRAEACGASDGLCRGGEDGRGVRRVGRDMHVDRCGGMRNAPFFFHLHEDEMWMLADAMIAAD